MGEDRIGWVIGENGWGTPWKRIIGHSSKNGGRKIDDVSLISRTIDNVKLISSKIDDVTLISNGVTSTMNDAMSHETTHISES